MRKASGLLHVTEYLPPMRHFTPKPTAVGPSMACQAPAHMDACQGQGETADTFLGHLDLSCVDTTPGARCALAPPLDADLDSDGYTELMRTRYRTSPAHRTQMAVFARRIGYTPITGPWATEARKILERIGT